MIRLLHQLRRDEKGNSFLELGIALPIMTAILLGAVDISRAVAERLAIEQAAQRTIELLQVKDFIFDAATDNRTIYKNEAASAAGVAATAVTVNAWLQCNSTIQTPMDQSHFNGTCSAGEVSARYVSVQIQKDFRPMFGTKYFPGANANGTFTLRSTAMVRVQ